MTSSPHHHVDSPSPSVSFLRLDIGSGGLDFIPRLQAHVGPFTRAERSQILGARLGPLHSGSTLAVIRSQGVPQTGVPSSGCTKSWCLCIPSIATSNVGAGHGRMAQGCSWRDHICSPYPDFQAIWVEKRVPSHFARCHVATVLPSAGTP